MAESENRPNEIELAFMKAESGRETVSLDLHGRSAVEAEGELDIFINHQFMSGHRYLRVVHGKGTGRLRQVVEDYLSSSPLVEAWRGSTVPSEQGARIYVILSEKE
ncbi:MAG: Smr/MutS family protein [Patescibacteria group bacterium]|nr:Smr/MutS family protein [Patescibacteria group bacterium]